ncbi:hypothetical protein K7X08_000927 [Anisodus acutangulus]|uniref:phosphoethanolamine N-methyltransferase n=1 Tax=Anisodus acutangulus TaxID=402998 RepID=A0A9Q1MMQ7_9SOLA|nr:hypothetical protein K7X08_000927 [Anisodus acutangulus]
MLDSKTADLDKEERPDVLSLLPPYEGKIVLELGAGIGRFTGELAKKVEKLIALDFIEGTIKKNESINGHHKNVKGLDERMVKWLKVGGYIFFRESCFHQSGDHNHKNNPTHYREPSFYTKVFRECHVNDGNGKSFELSLAGCKCIEAYVRNKKNQNQICWMWQKVGFEDDMGFQHFLDIVQ